MSTKPPDSPRHRTTRRPRALGAVTGLEQHVSPQWWQEIFNSTYLKTDADIVDDPALTQAEADIYSRALALATGHRTLDLCCGQGRHALELARRGFHLIDGFDRSHYLISRARKSALGERLPVCFREGDARHLPYRDSSFDRVYIAGNSFGYFSEPQDDAAVLSEVRRVLTAEGRLLLDLSDGDWVRATFEPRSWEWISPKEYVCRERQFSADGQKVISREMVGHIEKGVLVDQFYAARLYNRETIARLLEANGFGGITFAGEYETKSQKNQDLGMMGQRIIVTAEVVNAESRAHYHGSDTTAPRLNGANGHSGVTHAKVAGHSAALHGNGRNGLHANGKVLPNSSQRAGAGAALDKDRATSINGHANGRHTNGHGTSLPSPSQAQDVHANGSQGAHAAARVLRIGVVLGDPSKHDSVKPNGAFDEDDFETIGLLKTALSRLEGYQFTYFDRHASLLKDLAAATGSLDLVLNLCDEGYNNDPRLELHVSAALDILGIPYTGAGPGCLAHCYDKSLVRGVARELGIPVAPGIFVNPGDPSPDSLPFGFPVIVKPNFGDSSFGITQKSVANDAVALAQSIATVRRLTGGTRSLIVERLLTGEDLSVGLMGNGPNAFHVLPVTQEDYSAVPDGMPRICGYEAKWDPGSPYWNILSVPARVPERTKLNIVDACKLLFQRLGCRDYARFDWRLDGEGNPHLLEVNPNPGWCWDGHLAKMCRLAGMSYPQMLGLVLTSAGQRQGLTTAGSGDKVWPVIEGVSTGMAALKAF